MNERKSGENESLRRFRKRSCERKKWFRTRALAESGIYIMGTYAYHCQFCDGWHLATKKVLKDGP